MVRIQLSAPNITDIEKLAVQEVMESGWISKGKYRVLVEAQLADLCQRRFCLMTSSGTTALIAAIASVKRKKHLPVGVPSMCFPGVAQAVMAAGGTCKTLTVDGFGQINGSVNGLGALIAVDNYGGMPDLEDYERSCRIEGIPLIEDAAEAFGAKLGNRPAGNFGDVSIFSFFANKMVTAGEGGALLTDDPIIYQKAKAFIDFGRTSPVWHENIGINAHITEMQCALLSAQLRRLSELMAKRKALRTRYDSKMMKSRLQRHDPSVTPCPWLYCLIMNHRRTRDRALEACADAGIEARPYFPPLIMHRGIKTDLADCFSPDDTGLILSDCGICLPLHPGMTEQDVDDICKIVNGVEN